MTGPPAVDVAPLDGANAIAWRDLFVRSGSTCFCRWWHFVGTKNEWLARSTEHPELNRDEQLALVAARAPEAGGLVAVEGELVVGWMKLVPRALLPKLLKLGPYRALAREPDGGVWSVGCLLVDPSQRRRGVAEALVHASIDHVRSKGGHAVEAYPRRADHPLHDEEAWMGTPHIFASCGFVETSGDGPYPVMRRTL